MQFQHSHADAHRASYHPAFLQGGDSSQSASQLPIATHPEDAAFLEQFRPMPLTWLVAWLFRPKAHVAAAQHEPEPFEEHINGLA